LGPNGPASIRQAAGGVEPVRRRERIRSGRARVCGRGLRKETPPPSLRGRGPLLAYRIGAPCV
jgi:hypothetical protein